MIPLIIDQVTRDRLALVRGHAERNPIRLAELLEMQEAGRSVGEFRDFCCLISNDDFGVAFSIEEHPAGWARHVSVSIRVPLPGRVPSAAALEWIGRELGMRMDLLDRTITVYYEPPEPAPPRAVNVIEPVVLPIKKTPK